MDVAAAEEEDVVLLDAVLAGVPLVRGGDEDEALADPDGVEGLESEAGVASAGRGKVQERVSLTIPSCKREQSNSPSTVDGDTSITFEVHLFVAAADVLALLLVAALVRLLAALVGDCGKSAGASGASQRTGKRRCGTH